MELKGEKKCEKERSGEIECKTKIIRFEKKDIENGIR